MSQTPEQLFQEVLSQNAHQAENGELEFAQRHPNVMVFFCIDYRLRATHVVGDATPVYDIGRLPGAALTESAIETVLLSVVKHDVRLVIICRHTDCAMEKIASQPTVADLENFPTLIRAVRTRDRRLAELLTHPDVRARIALNELAVVDCLLDTHDGRIVEYSFISEEAKPEVTITLPQVPHVRASAN